MERLTEPMIVPSTGEILGYRSNPGVSDTKLKNKLGAYETAEEQGLLRWLPCKEGTRAFEIVSDCDLPADCYTKRMCKGCEYRHLYIEPIIFVTEIDILWKQKEFGKTVFLTREEAEKALAEMG